MRRKKPEKKPNHERWLITYSDLITLLMIFFIVMYASSNADTKKYSQLAKSLSSAFGGGKSIIGASDNFSIEEPKEAVKEPIANEEQQTKEQQAQELTEEQKLEEVKKQVDKLTSSSDLKGSISTNIEERGLVISFTDNVFFDSGKADIKTEAQKRLISLAAILNKIDNYVRVEGNTDNLPINTAYFHSNWQLSSVRAANVVEFLVDKAGMNAARLSSVGYGEHRPVSPNNSEVGRSKNRRVDIVILNTKYNGSETKNK